MIHTEEEAKTKWCPMSRVSAFPHKGGDEISLFSNRDICFLVPGNSFDPATDITKCIASDCMMWRWDETTETEPSLTPEGTIGYLPLPIDQWKGHCRLGGRP